MLPENKLIASSTVVMGLLSIVTAIARGCTAGISLNVWYCLGACSWLVCWGGERRARPAQLDSHAPNDTARAHPPSHARTRSLLSTRMHTRAPGRQRLWAHCS